MAASNVGGRGVSARDTLGEAFERLVAGESPGGGEAVLAAIAAAPLSAELLLALAAPLRRRAVPLEPPPNRRVVDVHDATAGGRGLAELGVGAALLAAAGDATVAHHPSLARAPAMARALGLPLTLGPDAVRDALDWSGFALLGPARFHPHAGPLLALAEVAPRLVALLGPLLHPAPNVTQLVLVDTVEACAPVLDALVELGARGALVCASGGAPFLSPYADTVGHAWLDGIRSVFVHPAQGEAPDLGTAGVARDAARVAAALAGRPEPYAEPLAWTAGAALWAGGLLPSLGEARAWAEERRAQGVDLDELLGGRAPTSPTRRGHASASTAPPPPRPPRAAARPARHRRG